MNRKQFFNKGIRDLARDLWQSPVGKNIELRLHGVANLLDPITYQENHSKADPAFAEVLVRPPGAVEPDEFQKRCTECNDCIKACVNHAIFEIKGSGPVINPNQTACILCTDYPCIEACQEDALEMLAEGILPNFGSVRIETRLCENSAEYPAPDPGQCHACLDACPVEGAVLQNGPGDMPVFTSSCTGCGMCVEACPVFPKALDIVADQL